ncbi:MAG: outer membrane beta-barrel protein [Devosia sp.]|nr:outer membrane beta-barrel protein [Devosia sp.]
MPFAKSKRSFAFLGRLGAVGLMVVAVAPVAARADGAGGSAGEIGETGQLLSPEPIGGASGWSAAPPVESMLPFYDLDWSLGLRGSYIRDSQSGDRYKALALPSVTLTHTSDHFAYHGTADGQFSKTGDGAINVDAARLAIGTALQFDPETSLSSNASLSMTQEDPNSPDVGSNVVETPKEYSGSADSTFKHGFGRFNVSVSGSAGRDIYGSTTLTGGALVDNTGQNNTHGGVGLRLGFQLTPIIELFAEGNATRAVYDAPLASLSTKLDGNLFTVMGGASANWHDRLIASASAGFGVERFDAASLADVRATLYDASLTYKPDSTLTLTGDFTTTMGAPGVTGSGTAKLDYEATASAAYQINDWLGWRASAGWHDTSFAASSGTDTGYTLGVGADYLLSRHAMLSADYGFEHDEVPPAPAQDVHTVTLGLTLKK